jgi:oligopeptide/dipeptide ABC transporter ATP-binding protein
MSDATTPVLEVTDLRVHFPMRAKHVVRAVDGVSFDIAPGESVGLIGESGSGKSTVARAVMQLVEPTDGSVSLGGRDLATMDRRERRAVRRRYQMVFQDSGSALDPRVTIGSSMREPLEVQRIAKGAAADALVGAALERVGLTAGHAGRYPHELSGGQRQRVNIARALVLEPELLVCDEAVSALDLSLQADVLNLLGDLRRELRLAYLFIGHDLTVVAHVADRVGVMYLGKLMELGPTDDVMLRPAHPYTVALRSAEPETVPVSLRSRQRVILEGDIPSPIAPPSGCVFHTRCPDAQADCASVVPTWRPLSADRWIACHHPRVQETDMTNSQGGVPQ